MPERQQTGAGIPSAQPPFPGRLFGAEPGRGSSSPAHEASVGSAVRVAAEVVIRASSIVATLWITRSLGVAAFGSFVLALSFGLLVAEFADLGLNALAVPLVVRSPRNLGALLRLKAALSLLVLMGGLVLMPAAASWMGVGVPLLALTTGHFLGLTWIEIAGSALRALGRRLDEAAVLSGFRLALLALVFATPREAGVQGAALAYALASVAGLGFAGLALFRAPLPRDGDEEPLPPRAILRMAIPLGANSYLAILSTRVEIFALQSLASAGLVGLFTGALRIVESLLTLPAAIAAGALPTLSRPLAGDRRAAAQRTLGAVVWIGIPAAAGLALRAPDILRVLGPGFEEGAAALRILAVALLVCFANTVLFHLLIAAGRTDVMPRLTGLRVLVAGLLSVPLVARFGATGAAGAFTLAEVFLCAALLRETRVYAEVEILRPARWAIVASAPMALLLFVVRWPLPVSVAASVLLFAAMAATILSRGTEEGGLA